MSQSVKVTPIEKTTKSSSHCLHTDHEEIVRWGVLDLCSNIETWDRRSYAKGMEQKNEHIFQTITQHNLHTSNTKPPHRLRHILSYT